MLLRFSSFELPAAVLVLGVFSGRMSRAMCNEEQSIEENRFEFAHSLSALKRAVGERLASCWRSVLPPPSKALCVLLSFGGGWNWLLDFGLWVLNSVSNHLLRK